MIKPTPEGQIRDRARRKSADDRGLPAPGTKRWVIRRKAEVVAAVRGGLLSLEEACARYTLTVEEFLAWQIRSISTAWRDCARRASSSTGSSRNSYRIVNAPVLKTGALLFRFHDLRLARAKPKMRQEHRVAARCSPDGTGAQGTETDDENSIARRSGRRPGIVATVGARAETIYVADPDAVVAPGYMVSSEPTYVVRERSVIVAEPPGGEAPSLPRRERIVVVPRA